MFSTKQIKQDLQAMPFQEFKAKLDLYTDLKSAGVYDNIMLMLLENEMERRIANWEIVYA
jgi:hypothetical protein